MSFAGVNRNKRSICLDLQRPEDRETLLSLCTGADAIVENMRAGVMDRLGVGYEVVAERNPQIVYACVRGYGDPRTGRSPYADWPALDPAGQAAGGLVAATGGLYNLAITDIYAGTLMALGLLSAVHRARATGQGDFVDVAMYDAMLTLLKSNVASYGLTGKVRSPGSTPLVPFTLFPCADGEVAIAAPVERHWRELCDAMGREDLKTDERTRSNPKRTANRAFTEAQVAAWTTTLSKQEVVAALGGKVPCGPANTLAEVFADPHVAARQLLETCELPGDNPAVPTMGSAIRLLRSATGLHQPPPTLGQHQHDILAEFGLDGAQD